MGEIWGRYGGEMGERWGRDELASLLAGEQELVRHELRLAQLDL